MSLLSLLVSLSEAPVRTARVERLCWLCDKIIMPRQKYRNAGARFWAHDHCVTKVGLKIQAAGEAGVR